MTCPFSEEYTLFWTASALYLVATAVSVPRILCGWQRRTAHTLALTLLIGGFLFQTLSLYMRGVERGEFPLTDPFETLHSIAWALVGTNLVVRQMFRLNLTNAFSAALAAAISLLAMVSPGWSLPVQRSSVSSPWIEFHAGLAILAYALFGILAMTAAMLLAQHASLKQKRFGAFFSLLPSVRKLERFNGAILVVALSLLTLSLAIGTLNWLTHSTSLPPMKLIVATALWSAYAFALWLHRQQHLNATQFAQAVLLLFVAAILSLWPLTRTNREVPSTTIASPAQ